MPMRARLVPALLAALAALVALAALPAAAAPPPRVGGEVLVKFREGTAPPGRAAALAAHAHAPLADLDGGWLRVRLRPGETVEEAIAGYLGDPAVEWAQPNFVYRALATFPNDPFYGQQWALHNAPTTVPRTLLQSGDGLCPAPGVCPNAPNPGVAGDDIGAEAAWDLVHDCTSVVVAVVDTGVNYAHQDLAANMWVDPTGVHTAHGWDFVANGGLGDADPMDEQGHGTHVAGIVGARGNDGVGTTGVCWSARIMAVRVLDATGSGTTVSIRQGVDFARVNGANVINLSLGGTGNDALFAQAIDDAVNAGVLVVAAAGNDGTSDDVTPTYPCSFPSPGLVCVAALDQAYQLADFSNWGPVSVHLGAPGVNVASTWAGTTTALQDAFATGWSYSAGWTLGSDHGAAALVDPPGYLSGQTGAAAADDRAWTTFDGTGADVVTLAGAAALDLAPGAYLRARCATTPGDPFQNATSVLLEEDTNLHSGGRVAAGVDASPCKGTATTTVGLQLQAASGAAHGVLLAPFEVKKLRFDATSYDVLSGTSMATPVVAGVAALVKQYQPAFTPADLAGALLGGGVPVPALATRTRSGRAVSAAGALRYLSPPRGLAYSVVN